MNESVMCVLIEKESAIAYGAADTDQRDLGLEDGG